MQPSFLDSLGCEELAAIARFLSSRPRCKKWYRYIENSWYRKLFTPPSPFSRILGYLFKEIGAGNLKWNPKLSKLSGDGSCGIPLELTLDSTLVDKNTTVHNDGKCVIPVEVYCELIRRFGGLEKLKIGDLFSLDQLQIEVAIASTSSSISYTRILCLRACRYSSLHPYQALISQCGDSLKRIELEGDFERHEWIALFNILRTECTSITEINTAPFRKHEKFPLSEFTSFLVYCGSRIRRANLMVLKHTITLLLDVIAKCPNIRTPLFLNYDDDFTSYLPLAHHAESIRLMGIDRYANEPKLMSMETFFNDAVNMSEFTCTCSTADTIRFAFAQPKPLLHELRLTSEVCGILTEDAALLISKSTKWLQVLDIEFVCSKDVLNLRHLVETCCVTLEDVSIVCLDTWDEEDAGIYFIRDAVSLFRDHRNLRKLSFCVEIEKGGSGALTKVAALITQNWQSLRNSFCVLSLDGGISWDSFL